jgi:hypothetical protein
MFRGSASARGGGEKEALLALVEPDGILLR